MKRPAAAMKRPAAAAAAVKPVMKNALKVPARPHPNDKQIPITAKPPIRGVWYCSDCSGLDVGAMALTRVIGEEGFHHWLASDLNPDCRAVLRATFPDLEHIFEDATKHDSKLLKSDLIALHKEVLLVYTSGFPCQPYSKQGNQEGINDSRAPVIYDELLLIQDLSPDLVLLENVEPFAKDPRFRELFQEVLNLLVKIGKGRYYVDWKILDSYTHAKVPATRKRVYIVAVKKTRLQKTWSWPSPQKPVPLKSVVRSAGKKFPLDQLSNTNINNLDAAVKKVKGQGKSLKDPYVIDLAGSQSFGVGVSFDKFPTITKSHANSLWLSHYQRFATPEEILAAQGILKKDIVIPAGMNRKKIAEMAGNSFTLPMFQKLFEAILPALGLDA